MRRSYSKWLVACGLLQLFSAHAAGNIPLAISPIIVKMGTASQFAAVEVSNRGDQATGIEVEMMRVEWVNGQEKYHPTTDFIVSPATFRLADMRNRMVRFRYSGPRNDTEGFYRLFIRQLPGVVSEKQLNMVFNLGIPVFIAPTTERAALALASPAAGTGAATGNTSFELRNTGNVTVTLIRLEGGAECPDGKQALQGRISPGQTFALKTNVLPCITNVQTDRGPISLTRP